MNPVKLFIYGTLRKEAKHQIAKSKSLGLDSVAGKIYNIKGIYPGFKRGGGEVIGEVVEVDEDALQHIDYYEGDEYKRVKIVTAKGTEVWIYEYLPNIHSFVEIKSGDWTQVSA